MGRESKPEVLEPRSIKNAAATQKPRLTRFNSPPAEAVLYGWEDQCQALPTKQRAGQSWSPS